ncbi:hypothetical protein SDC9_191848 [bioreactor metagenome]|uniref:Uncharacterized protein n=1 Tax=bioreactor metagenome TaxID=1076179 RepID=A0A645I0A4_9ZZZZ
MEQLAQGQGGEGHGVGGGTGGQGVGQDIVAQPVGQQGQPSHHDALPRQPKGKAVGEQALMGVPGGLIHDPLLHRLHAQRQGGQRVGHQIQP